MNADEALGLGFIDRIVAPDNLEAAALAWARELASGAVVAMGYAKAAIDGGFDLDLPEALTLEAERFADCFVTEDAATGIASFLEHGPGKATFHGR